MKYAAVLFGILALLVLGAFGLAAFERSRADALTARALITANQTAQRATTASSLVTLLVVVIVVLLLLIVLAVLVLLVTRRLRTRRTAPAGRWVSGPNAYWGRAQEKSLPAQDVNALLGAFLQVQMVQALQGLRPQHQPAMPPDDGEIDVWYPPD